MQFNLVDGIIIAVVLHQSVMGWKRGLVSVVSESIAFIVALWVAVRFHGAVGTLAAQKFGIAKEWNSVVGYILIVIPTEVMMNIAAGQLIEKLPQELVSSKVNRWFGSLFSGANSLLFLAITLLIILAIPVRGTLKREIHSSVFGNTFVGIVQYYGGSIGPSLDTITRQAAKFITIQPLSRETVNLDVYPEAEQLTEDEKSERYMVDRINEERTKAGVSALGVRGDLTAAARTHSRDMFEKRYFAHINLDGQDVVRRVTVHGAGYARIGENLAYAPEMEIAHTGLMNSEEHRKNILDPAWNFIGVGVIDGNIYGKMFTQVFAY